MKFILLFDLDDTLLNTNIDQFQKAYLGALGKYLSHRFDPETMIRTLMRATQKMIENDRPDRTLMETFDAAFYPALGVKKEDVHDEIAAFYREVFPTIKSVTTPIPNAVKTIDYAVAEGHRVVIATNPLFPQTATHQRLSWAGLPVDRYPFEIVSTYETFHFAKPNPAYYAEIVAQLGCPEDPVIMFGNDPDLDITPAAKMGFSTGWPGGSEYPRLDSRIPPTWKGEMSEITAWIKDYRPVVSPLSATVPAILATLKASPAAIATHTRQFQLEEWKLQPAAGEWSVGEILRHLGDVEAEVYLPRIERILNEVNPQLPAIDTSGWAVQRNYNLTDGKEALEVFTRRRMETIQTLARLESKEWKKPAIHAINGQIDLQAVAAAICAHDRRHLRQIVETIKPGQASKQAR